MVVPRALVELQSLLYVGSGLLMNAFVVLNGVGYLKLVARRGFFHISGRILLVYYWMRSESKVKQDL